MVCEICREVLRLMESHGGFLRLGIIPVHENMWISDYLMSAWASVYGYDVECKKAKQKQNKTNKQKQTNKQKNSAQGLIRFIDISGTPIL